MEVVFHHIGSPRKTITSQNESIDRNLVRTVPGFSGGGPLSAFVAVMGGLSAEARLGTSKVSDDDGAPSSLPVIVGAYLSFTIERSRLNGCKWLLFRAEVKLMLVFSGRGNAKTSHTYMAPIIIDNGLEKYRIHYGKLANINPLVR